MNRVRSIVEKHTASLPLMERVYSQELPRPYEIAKELGAQGVSELFSEIAAMADERDSLDEANGDELDDFWRAMMRLSSVIPYQARLYPAPVLEGLAHENATVRFHVARGLSKVPFRRAFPKLRHALAKETDELTGRVLSEAITACASPVRCFAEALARFMRLPVVWRDA